MFGFVILERLSAGVLHGVGVQVCVRRLVREEDFGASGLGVRSMACFRGKSV
jgi:hypothetical protein